MISAILLAAGLSQRYKKGNKLLSKINKKELILISLENILKSKIKSVIIVLGKDKNKIKKILPKSKKIKVVLNPKYKSGLSSSIKYGIKHIDLNSKYFFVSLGDMPFFSYKHYNKMIEITKKKNFTMLVPVFKKTLRNPVLFPISFVEELKKINGDSGAKKIIKNFKFRKLRFGSEKIFQDFDSVASFKNII